jgi:uncharacterized protein YcbK (DUF882 family)
LVVVAVSSACGRIASGLLARTSVRVALAALALFIAGNALRYAAADDDTRTLTMHHVHTGETITVTYMRDGRYDRAALKKLDWFLRDWRRNEETRMDPHLFDVLWQAYRDTGATKPIEIICGFRAPGTNAFLRTRSGGVARYSQHILGKAIDFFIPGVPLSKLRAVGLQMQRGGVGFYPRSGSPFVHLDVGTVRHWPGISRAQLVKIFPHGRTVHIPSDGKPLPGYAEALAEIEREGNVPNARSLKLARAAGAITAYEERVAELVGQGRRQSLIALVNSGRDNGVGRGEARPLALASLSRQPVPVASAVPVPPARPPLMTLASAESKPVAPARTAFVGPAKTASASNVFDQRFWPGPVQNVTKPTMPFEIAGADMTSTGSTRSSHELLAYASDTRAQVTRKPVQKPMGQHLRAHLPRLVSPAWADTIEAPLTMEAKSLLGTPMAIGGQRLGSPWMRAAMLTPSVSHAMMVSRLRDNDPRLLRDLLYKPVRAVAISFSDDPQAGMTTDRFSGDAVVFLATTRFVPQQTASLQ